VDLVQVTSGITKALEKLGKGAPKFEYQSNDIIATIEDLQATFKSMKKDLDMEEHDINSAFERDRLGLQNQQAFAEKSRNEKQAIEESKTEENNQAKDDRDEETKDRNADQEFLDQTTVECETKAHQFDQRSKTRSDELTALSSAIEELKSGAAANFGANKKLVGLAQKSSKAAPASFMQLKSIKQHKDAEETALIQHVRAVLSAAADKSGSHALSSIVAKMSVAEDHFVKVRGLIKDLIAKLKDDAKQEATQKNFCDNAMRKAINDRDTANSQIEVANAKITTATATKNDLEDEINTLNSQIADLKKALLEATELRNDEKAENTKTMDMSEDGVESVKRALATLQAFYSNAFVQKGKYTPPNADRNGNTFGDLAPDTFANEDYHGSQSESKGIIGILEVILSDFSRTKKKAAEDDAESKKAFEAFEADTDKDVSAKQKRINKADGELANAESEILDQQQALSDAEELLAGSKDALDDLKAMCVEGEETWEERKAKREAEINALKEALDIFENWKQ